MGETVTSKYYKGYWIILFGFPVACVFIILYFALEYNTQGIIFISGLIVGSVITYLVKYSRSMPRKIVIDSEYITVDNYFINKHIVIKYADIDSSRTVKPVPNGKSTADLRSLVLELHDGTTFRIDEIDFANYSELKRAIYDHLFRGK